MIQSKVYMEITVENLSKHVSNIAIIVHITNNTIT